MNETRKLIDKLVDEATFPSHIAKPGKPAEDPTPLPNPDRDEGLRFVWERVRPADWRDPVDAYCRVDDRRRVDRAIRYFTGTEPTFAEAEAPGWLRVQAEGYRSGPAGP